jgi:hypothetical protein
MLAKLAFDGEGDADRQRMRPTVTFLKTTLIFIQINALKYFHSSACIITLLLLSMYNNTFAANCQPTTDSIAPAICSGDTFRLAGNVYTQTGNYTDTLTNAGGCDSIVTILLTVKSPLTNIQNLGICQGDSAQFGHTWYYQSGTYSDTLTATGGCDSIITLNLTVNLILHQSITITICSTNPFYIGNTPYDSTGKYTDTITSSLGCDSIVNLNLTVKPALAVSLNWDALYTLNLLDASSGQPTAFWCHGDYPNVISISAAGIPAGGIFSGAGISNDSLYADSLLLAGHVIDTISYFYSDGNGCSQTAVGYVNFLYCLGLQQITGNSTITLYPNPTTGQLFIKPENLPAGRQGIQPQTTTIYDVNGRIIQTMPFKSEADVKNLSPGVYFIELRSNGELARKMFIKIQPL